SISNSRLTELRRGKGRWIADATVLALPRADRKPPRFLPARCLDLALPDPVAFAVIAAKPIRRHRHVEAQINLAAVQRLLPTTVVGSYPQPDWLVDRQMLGTRLPPRVRAREIWRIPPEFLEQAQDDATVVAIRDMERAGIDIVTDGAIRRES